MNENFYSQNVDYPAVIGFTLAIAAAVYLIFLQIAVIFFRNKEKINLQKETNRLLRKLAGEEPLNENP